MKNELSIKPSFIYKKQEVLNFDIKSYNDYIINLFRNDNLYVDIILFDDTINKHYLSIYLIEVNDEEKEELSKYISNQFELIKTFNEKFRAIEYIELNFLNNKIEVCLKLVTNIKIHNKK